MLQDSSHVSYILLSSKDIRKDAECGLRNGQHSMLRKVLICELLFPLNRYFSLSFSHSSVRDKIVLILASFNLDRSSASYETSDLAVSSLLFLSSGHSFGKEFIPSDFSEYYDFLAIAFAPRRASRARFRFEISSMEDRSIFSIYSMVMKYPFKLSRRLHSVCSLGVRLS